jgi:5'/3'-nucleotidase
MRCMGVLRRIVLLFLIVGAAKAAPSGVAASVAPGSEQPQQPFRILVTNDDGVRAPGILALAQELKTIGDVSIVAPAENQSGKGHSLSITDPVYVDDVTLPTGLQALSATATPASCVKLALLSLLKERPHLVVSGINRGYNLGKTAYVSGTVGAAREGALNDIPAIAASMDIEKGWSDYTAAARATTELARLVKEQGLPPGVFLNVNVPAGAPKGMRWATQSALMGQESWIEHKNPRGRRYFWNDYEDSRKDVDGTDVAVAAAGYIAVVPLRASEYDAAAAEKLKSWKFR